MSTAEATQYDSNVKTLGDSIVALTLLQAKQLADYLENVQWKEEAGPDPQPQLEIERGQTIVLQRLSRRSSWKN